MGQFLSILEKVERRKNVNILDNRVLTNYRQHWWFLGIWPTVDDGDSKRVLPYRVIPSVVFFISCLTLSLCLYNLTVGTRGLEQVCKLLLTVSLAAVMAAKVSCFVLHATAMSTLCDDLDAMHEGQRRGGSPEVLDRLRTMKLVSKAFSVYLPKTFFLLLFVALPLVIMQAFQSRVPVKGLLYPWDTTVSPHFEISVLFEVASDISAMIMVSFCDVLCIDILCQLWTEFGILLFNIETCVHPAGPPDNIPLNVIQVINTTTTTRHKSEWSLPIHKKLLKVWRRLIGRDIGKRRISRSGPAGVPREQTGTREGDPPPGAVVLRECVQHHQALLRFANDFESVFNAYLSSQMFSSSIMGITTILYLTSVEEWGPQQMGGAFNGLCLSLELALICTISSKITEQSERVRIAMYSVDWTSASEGFKRSMRIIMSVSNCPVEIAAMGFVPFTMRTFQEVMEKSYSVLMAVIDIKNSRK